MTRSTSRKGRRRAISGTSKTFPISRRTPCSQSTYSAIYVTWLSWPSSLRYAFESRHRRSPLRLLLAGRESSVVSALLHGGSKLLRKGASIRYLSSRTSPGMSSKSLSSKPKDLKISRGATSILKYKSMNMRCVTHGLSVLALAALAVTTGVHASSFSGLAKRQVAEVESTLGCNATGPLGGKWAVDVSPCVAGQK